MATELKSDELKSRPVLIVESSRAHAKMLSELCRQNRFSPVVRGGMEESLDAVRALPAIAGIVVGGRLADGDGIDLIYRLRALPHLSSTPIFFIESEGDNARARAALIAGATEICAGEPFHGIADALKAIGAESEGAVLSGRVLIVEDDSAIARLIAVVCGKLGLGVDMADSVDRALDLFKGNHYQAVITDVVLVDRKTGIDLVRQIRHMPDRTPILVMSNYDDTARRIEVLRSGADDYLPKPFLAEELFWRLCNLLSHAEIEKAAGSSESVQRSDEATISSLGNLSEREMMVARAIAQGLSDKQIALRFDISFWTVRSHINRIFTKLGLFNRASLVKYMVQHGALGDIRS